MDCKIRHSYNSNGNLGTAGPEVGSLDLVDVVFRKTLKSIQGDAEAGKSIL
jgi:hypothetical protein